MAMSIRERTREVAVLRTLGFTRHFILSLFLGESVTLAVAGGLLGVLLAAVLMRIISHSPAVGIPASMKVTPPTVLVALFVSALVGLLSSVIPSYHATRVSIVDGLRHIG